MCNRLDTIPACDRQTDGHLAMARCPCHGKITMRGKNDPKSVHKNNFYKHYFLIMLTQCTVSYNQQQQDISSSM